MDIRVVIANELVKLLNTNKWYKIAYTTAELNNQKQDEHQILEINVHHSYKYIGEPHKRRWWTLPGSSTLPPVYYKTSCTITFANGKVNIDYHDKKFETRKFTVDYADPKLFKKVVTNVYKALFGSQQGEIVNFFTRFAMPLIKKTHPKLIADNLINIQPMLKPSSLVFYTKYNSHLTKSKPEESGHSSP